MLVTKQALPFFYCTKTERKKKMKLFSTEAVSKYHPDKYADQISDAILTECLRQDPTSHCGIETLVKDDIVVVSGEIKTEAVIDIPSIVAKVANKLH